VFADVVGHGRAAALLEAAVRSGRPSHAYLIIGPESAGKRTLARAFAQALNCTAPLDERPCRACQPCRLIAADAHPDVRLIDRTTGADERRARTARNIPIEAVRALQHDAGLTSHLGGFKLYLIDGAEDLSLPAMDALLKTLEEPAPRVVIVLTCVDAGLLPQTVVSRCQVVKLGRVGPDEIARAVTERHGLDSDRAALLAHLADGRPGRAFALALDQGALEEREELLAELIELDGADRVQRLKTAERMAQAWTKSRDLVDRRLELLLLWWRDLLLTASGREELVVNWDRLALLRERGARLGVARAREGVRAVDQARLQLDENVQARLALELMVLSLPRLAA
jgi:DNA polymerase-3 subunit delta'